MTLDVKGPMANSPKEGATSERLIPMVMHHIASRSEREQSLGGTLASIRDGVYRFFGREMEPYGGVHLDSSGKSKGEIAAQAMHKPRVTTEIFENIQ